MKILGLLFIVILTGCATARPFDTDLINGKIYRFKVLIVDSIPGGHWGLHQYDSRDDLHLIVLPKEAFPRCLAHEALHMFYGNFHEGRESIDYC